MRCADWKAVYIDKTKTLEDWRKAKDAEYAAQRKSASGAPTPAGNLPFKRQAHFSTSDENILTTNPNYNLGRAYQINCQKCVPAYEMRMRGYDVIARPTFNLATDKFAGKHWKEAFKGSVVIDFLVGSGKAEIIAQMRKWGDNARGEVYVVWKNGDSHVFVAENRSGSIHFLDPQSGELDVEYYFENVKDGLTQLWRIDEPEPNETYIKLCCKEIK